MGNRPRTMPIWSRYDTLRITCDDTKPGYWAECHWYCCGHCCDATGHDHTPWFMKLWWATIGPVASPIWEFGAWRGWWN